jgi:hypothetical protein
MRNYYGDFRLSYPVLLQLTFRFKKMKTLMTLVLSAAILFSSCSKDPDTEPKSGEALTTNPAVPAQEGQQAITGVTANNNGIVYTQFNKELSYNKFLTIDVDGNGENDFYFTSVLIYYDGQSHLYLTASPVSKNGGMLQLDETQELVTNGMWARPLDAGAEIAPAPGANTIWSNFMIKGVALDVAETSSHVKTFNGPWVGKQDKYLALRIRINGAVHYGWVRMSHTTSEERLVLTGYAYNTVAGEKIKAGQTLK